MSRSADHPSWLVRRVAARYLPVLDKRSVDWVLDERHGEGYEPLARRRAEEFRRDAHRHFKSRLIGALVVPAAPGVGSRLVRAFAAALRSDHFSDTDALTRDLLSRIEATEWSVREGHDHAHLFHVLASAATLSSTTLIDLGLRWGRSPEGQTWAACVQNLGADMAVWRAAAATLRSQNSGGSDGLGQRDLVGVLLGHEEARRDPEIRAALRNLTDANEPRVRAALALEEAPETFAYDVRRIMMFSRSEHLVLPLLRAASAEQLRALSADLLTPWLTEAGRFVGPAEAAAARETAILALGHAGPPNPPRPRARGNIR